MTGPLSAKRPSAEHLPAERLSAATLGRLPAGIAIPAYDRRALRPTVLHLGAGAFHRCHQAEYADDVLADGATVGAIAAVNLRPPDLDAAIGVQDGLYCRELRTGDHVERRIIGSILAAHTVPDPADPAHRPALERALATASDPAIGVISCTVTEKGYCHVPATGELDDAHPDIVHDIADPRHPRSLPGFVLETIRRRLAAGLPLPVLLSCDNVPGNGATFRRVVTGLAERVAPELAARIAAEALFPDTMVDRIVPATREENVRAFAEATGLHDAGLVSGEPFRMWVIDAIARDRLPAWDRAGAILTPQVHVYETLKMRVLNGIQSTTCQLGVLAGIPTMADLMADPDLRAFARRSIEREVVPSLPPVPGIDIPAYVEQSIARLSDPSLRHACTQISTDGSRKIRQRVIEPLLAARAEGRSTPCLLLGLAGWIRYVSGRGTDGVPHPVDDPLAAEAAAIDRATGGDPFAYARGIAGVRSVFPDRFADDAALVDALGTTLTMLDRLGPRAAVRSVLGDTNEEGRG